MKLISARASRAPAPISTEKRAPDIFVARSKSRMPSAGPISQCGLRLEVERARLAVPPHFLVVRGARVPTGTLACGRFGSVISSADRCCSTWSSSNLELLDLLRRALCSPRRCRTHPALAASRARPRLPDGVLLALEPFDLGDQPAPARFERRRAAPARRRVAVLGCCRAARTSSMCSRTSAGSSMPKSYTGALERRGTMPAMSRIRARGRPA